MDSSDKTMDEIDYLRHSICKTALRHVLERKYCEKDSALEKVCLNSKAMGKFEDFLVTGGELEDFVRDMNNTIKEYKETPISSEPTFRFDKPALQESEPKRAKRFEFSEEQCKHGSHWLEVKPPICDDCGWRKSHTPPIPPFRYHPKECKHRGKLMKTIPPICSDCGWDDWCTSFSLKEE